jgi:hypothetical protein
MQANDLAMLAKHETRRRKKAKPTTGKMLVFTDHLWKTHLDDEGADLATSEAV